MTDKEPKFTPGPWSAHCSRDFSAVYTNDGIEVCYCDTQCEDDDEGTVAANATLMAAAPEMYEMLSDLATCGAIVNSYYTVRINALLAKARGEVVEK